MASSLLRSARVPGAAFRAARVAPPGRSAIRMMGSTQTGPSLAERAQEMGIQFILVSFDDLFGVSRSKLVPTRVAAEAEESGAGFAGFAAHFDMSPADPDMLAMPDASTLVRLPWAKNMGWVASNLEIRGEEFNQGPRNVLRRVLGDLSESRGWTLKTGVECEFFLISPDASELADTRDVAAKPCYDQSALFRQRGFVCELNEAMEEMGFPPYQTDHEDANGQFECNWEYDDALKTADRHSLFKFTVRCLAEKHGYRSTFMPKPFSHLTGNGCHVHLTLHDEKTGENIFKQGGDADGFGTACLGTTGTQFVAGLLSHAKGICAVTNPTVNSYKRLSAPPTASGATWAPNTISWSGNNRSHMIRIPDAPRIELRLADMATNPYLLPAAALSAGMSGVDAKATPPSPIEANAYDSSAAEVMQSAETLPENLLDALRALSTDASITAGLGEECVNALVALRKAQWADYKAHLTEWEKLHTLDC